MAQVRADRPGVMLPEPSTRRRPICATIALLVAVLAAIALMWNFSRRPARQQAQVPAPLALAEAPPATAPAPPPDEEAAAPAAAASAAPAAAEERAPAEQPEMSARKQAQIARVINDGRPSLKTCYQRALTRDDRLVHGDLTVRLSVGSSGRVSDVNIKGPRKFRAVEPCLETAISKWTFPKAPASYDAEFPLALEGAQ
jgi:outer membrane biosynthesis protein TonB